MNDEKLCTNKNPISNLEVKKYIAHILFIV